MNEALANDVANLIEQCLKKDKEIERLNNKVEELMTLYTTEREVKEDYKAIIKEVREYIEENIEEKKSWLNGIPDYTVFKGDAQKLLEILDKVD